MMNVSHIHFFPKFITFLIFYQICGQICASSKLTDVVPLIRSDGYEVQEHEVVTSDGYILELHRVPNKRFERTSSHQSKPIALLGHCTFASSAAFVVLGPTRGLAYKLANEGYDVWLMNSRGTSYSSRHQNMTSKSIEFWKFGIHEQAVYDLSASIDYILNLTNQTHLDYIGFSLGNTHLFILLSERPEYNEKIRSGIALGPAVFLNDSTGFLPDILAPHSSVILDFSLATNTYQFPNPEFDIRGLAMSFCKSRLVLFRNKCIAALVILGAENNGNINMNLVQFFLEFFPESISLRQAVHFAQMMVSGKFEKFNFGYRKNMRVYGKSTPPLYDLSKVTAPISLFWGNGDSLTPPSDVSKLRKTLRNVVFDYQVPFSSFSHMDFIWGKNAHSLVYDKILERLKIADTYKRL